MIADVAIAIKVAGERGHEGLPEEEDFTEAREQVLTMNFILGAHPRYSGEYLMHLRNSCLEGLQHALMPIHQKDCQAGWWRRSHFC